MGKSKENRKKLEGLERQIARHEEKIAEESLRYNPDIGRSNIGKRNSKPGKLGEPACYGAYPEGSDKWLLPKRTKAPSLVIHQVALIFI